jgi:bifunctional non-homologous end joining protein LigD
MAASHPLQTYRAKRNFSVTSEPEGELGKTGPSLSFVIQKHWASRLHYDFRLELDGSLKSWAVPKGPSLDPAVKRMAVHVEDHPISYGGFEGEIPHGQYGAGTVIVWDRGTWMPLEDPRAGYREGKLKFELRGEKLHGRWALVRMKKRDGEKQEAWLLMKEKDAEARTDLDITEAMPDSVLAAKAPARRSAAKKGAPKAKKPAHALPDGAVPAKLPAMLAPELATLAERPPGEGDWTYEIKFDGYRLLTRIDADGGVHCFTRNGKDWTHKLPGLAKALAGLGLTSTWLDGEIVVAGENGLPSFQALQGAFDSARTGSIEYFVFDLPFLDGHDLRELPLTRRRDLLAERLAAHPDGPVRFSQAFDLDPQTMLDSAHQAGLEGIIGKRADSPYRSARSSDWIKLKGRRRQEFVVCGFTDPQGSRSGFGSLILGVHDAKGELQYAGNVGTGFDDKRLKDLRKRLDALATAKSPFASPPARVGARNDMRPHWVKPTLVAEVYFAEWTKDGHIRHSSFHALREDKPARQITREESVMPPTTPRSKAAAPAPTAKKLPVRVTHPERVIDAQSGVTKGELVQFYAAVAPLMLEHLKGRPVALLRLPQGVDKPAFFQKHIERTELPGVELLDPAIDPDHPPYLEIRTAQGLLSAAQMNVIEFHTWNSTKRAPRKPDRMVFDLDPGEGVEWPQMQEAALLVKGFLDQLGLVSFLKTSGGKGLHVVVPLNSRTEWQRVKDFSQAIVQHLAQVIPQRFVAKSGPKNRVGRIFVDYLRNGFGATTACAWSARARPGLGVSVPVSWEELDELTSGAHWTVRTVAERLDAGNTPWQAYEDSRQGLAAAMKKLGFETTAVR